MKRRFLLLMVLLWCAGPLFADNLSLWSDTPAKSWMNEAYPIGNGYMGAMFFGGTGTDEIQISEEGIWAGGPGANKNYNYGNKKGSWKYLGEIQEALKAGNASKAAELAERHMIGEIASTPGEAEFGDYGAQQPFGSVFVTIDRQETPVKDYRRSLDIGNSLGKVEYVMDKVKFENEYFASYPSRLLVCRYTNDAAGGENYIVSFKSPHKLAVCKAEGKDLLRVSGKLVSNGEAFEGVIKVKTDGKCVGKDGQLFIQGAKNVELYVTVASAYRNQYPDYTGNDYRGINKKALLCAEKGSYEQLKREHQEDYKALFGRVSLDLGHSDQVVLPTSKRQVLYSKGAYDPQLEVLYFQYGRYMLISSSRPGTMPAHLQGKWNNQMNPPWACDYHMNINLQMIYWPAEVTNLSECHTPLLEYIDKLREPGRVTAREYFNARGWSVHTMNNAYGFTAPGWNFYWGYAPNSAGWLCNHLWEHYNFTGDENYLREKAYPIMKEVGEFWLDYLSEDTDGTLVSSPSYSPEHGGISAGAMIDQEIAWDVFTNLLDASRIVGDNTLFVDSIRTARERLSPLKVGKYGQLQEWKEDLDDPQNAHRHVSHLYALYPGDQISPLTTPGLAEAARRTLIYRGEEGTGWSLGWKINFWGRLLDGNQSYKMIRNILTPSIGEGRRPSGSGSYSNLLCAHPPFQIDGNMGAVSGMAELLLQSYTGTIDLLPALPVAWPQGNVKGLKARGGYTVDMEWKDGLLRKAVITASKPGECAVRYKNKVEKRNLKAGEQAVYLF